MRRNRRLLIECSFHVSTPDVTGRRVLRQVVVLPVRQGVVVRPAVDGWKRAIPVPVRNRRGHGPLEGIGLPGIRGGAPSAEKTPDEIEYESELYRRQRKGGI